MGKIPTGKRNGAASRTPYDRNKASKPFAKNNIFKFDKDHGQHILKNPGISDAIVDKAFLKPTDVVVEVGPGTGNITVRALDKAKKVIAIELDPRMAAEVTKRVQGGPLAKKLEVIIGDVIKMPQIPPCDALISNTPYQISSPLIFKMLAMPNPPKVAVLMLQREFAKRLVAKPGDSLYSRLSVNVNFWAKTRHIMKVAKSNFKPPPKVESDVVRIEPKIGSSRPSISFEEFDGLLRVLFNRKNKTLRASFTKEVLAMCERNYKTYCVLNGIEIDDSIVEDHSAGDEEVMDLDADHDGNENDDDDDDDKDEAEWDGISDSALPSQAGEDDPEGDADMDSNDDDDTPAFFKELDAQKTGAAAAKTPSKHAKTRVALVVRAKVYRALGDLADKRARMCGENDFLKLLAAFHKEGIHFS